MDWSHERILEFIENYESEPVLWNPAEPNHKKKKANSEAWLRIKANLSWHVSVDEIKGKMKSLMAYYRTHINKYKKSKMSGCKEEVYQTNWFAFTALHSFLAPLYECQLNSTQISEENETQITTDTEDSLLEEGSNSSVQKKLKRDNLSIEFIDTKPQMEEASQPIKNSCNDEYEIFGKLIACKIRKLKNTNTREIAMKDIYNIIFQAGITDRLGTEHL